MCLFTTVSHAEGEAQTASALAKFMASFFEKTSEITINSASFLSTVAMNNPQATAAFVALAASGSYGLYKIYNCEMMKRFREVMDRLGKIETRMNGIKNEIVAVVKDESSSVKQEIQASVEAEGEKARAKTKKARTDIKNVRIDVQESKNLQEQNHKKTVEALTDINGWNQDIEKKVSSANDQIQRVSEQQAGIKTTVDQVARDVKAVSAQQKTDSDKLASLNEGIENLNTKLNEQYDKVQEIWSAVVENLALDLPDVLEDSLQERLKNLKSSDDLKQESYPVAEMSVEKLMPQIKKVVVAQIAAHATQIQQGIGSSGSSRTSSISAVSGVSKEELFVVVREALAKQQEERSFNLILSSVDQMPEMMKGMSFLYKKVDLMERQMEVLLRLTHSMFHDMLRSAKDMNKKLDLAFKYNDSLRLAAPSFSIDRLLTKPRKKQEPDVPLIADGE